MANKAGAGTASVEVLTAEVRALMIGSRQVTLSVYRQLDQVPHGRIEPFGRVRDDRDKVPDAIYVIGRHTQSGALVRSLVREPWAGMIWTDSGDPWLRVGSRHLSSSYHRGVERCGLVHFDVNGEFRSFNLLDGDFALAKDPNLYPTLLIDIDEFLAQVAAPERAIAAAQRRYQQWQALPLIVLAGLR